MAELADYLNEDDGVKALCGVCADHEGLAAFKLGVALNTDTCESCGEKFDD